MGGRRETETWIPSHLLVDCCAADTENLAQEVSIQTVIERKLPILSTLRYVDNFIHHSMLAAILKICT